MKLELYFAPGACSFVPHFGLEAVQAATGQAYEPKLVKLHKGENKVPEYLALNPNAQVPVLVVDGQALTQIVAICDFLDRSFPQANLLPKDAWARARALSDLSWFNNTVHPTFTHFFMPHKFASDEAAQVAMKAKSVDDYAKLIERIQGKLGGGQPYLGGAAPNLLDAYALVLYRWGGMTGINPTSIQPYHDYVERLAKHPAIAAAIERERIPLHTYKPA
jgi:glutathione S-transferase